MKDKVGEGDRHQDAQLVDGDNDAGKAVLQRAVIAQPGRAGGDADRQIKPNSFLGIFLTSPALPATKTITQAISSTTAVRMAVPRLDSTPEMPILPRMEVKLAKMAEPAA